MNNKNHNLYHLLSCFFILYFQTNLAFAATEDVRWHAGIGDPTIFGWMAVLVYIIAIFLCSKQAIISKKSTEDAHFWAGLALFLLLLAINKQLDLQTWFTQTIKDNALAHGWYAHRKPVQIIFIVTLGLSFLIVLTSLQLFLTNSWRRHRLAWLGICLLCTFILMRASSFHHFDIFINHQVLGLTVNEVLEVGSILLIILGTFFNHNQTKVTVKSH
jgi:hypothetical protein